MIRQASPIWGLELTTRPRAADAREWRLQLETAPPPRGHSPTAPGNERPSGVTHEKCCQRNYDVAEGKAGSVQVSVHVAPYRAPSWRLPMQYTC